MPDRRNGLREKPSRRVTLIRSDTGTRVVGLVTDRESGKIALADEGGTFGGYQRRVSELLRQRVEDDKANAAHLTHFG